MKRIIKVGSIISLIIFTILIYISIKQDDNNFNYAYNKDCLYSLNTDWNIDNKIKKINLPTKIKKDNNDYVYLYNIINNNNNYYDELILYTSLGHFDVFVDNKQVYSFYDDEFFYYKNKMTTLLHRIKLNDKKNANEIKIKAYFDEKDNISFGVEKSYLSLNGEYQNLIIGDEIINIIVVGIILILGITFTIIGIIVKKKNINELIDLMNIGIFSIGIAIYLFLHSLTSYTIIKNLKVINSIYYTTVMLIPVPILNMIIYNKKVKNRFPALAMKYTIYINYIVQTILTLFEILDYNKMIMVTYICLLISILIVIIELIRDIRKEYYTILCSVPMIISCLIKLIKSISNNDIDLLKDNDIIFRIGFIYFVVAYTIYIISKYIKYYLLSIKSMTYKKLAYTDFLTNLYNRSAFEKRIEQLDCLSDNMTNIWFISIDINNLKEVNDTKGHNEGDKIIKDLAVILNKTFNEITKDLFRIGGDEFFVIVNTADKDLINDALKDLYIYIEEYNFENENSISIALGYDNVEDSYIRHAISKVDKKMYDNKRKIKNG